MILSWWWGALLVAAALLGWSALSARTVLYPDRRVLPAPNPLPSYTAHQVPSPEGAFDVWRLRPSSSPRARILICHGYYANRLQVLDIAQGLRERGYESLLFELRGHGQRPGPCTFGMKETEDALTVLRWAKREQVLPLGVLGFSMGASVCCQVAFREPAIRAVVVDSIYSRLFPVLRRGLWQRYHVPPFPLAWLTLWSVQAALRARLAAIDPVTVAPKLCLPLFAIQGGEDRRVTPLLGREFYRVWAGPKERWFEPKIAHVGMFATHPHEYCERIAAFFDGVFA